MILSRTKSFLLCFFSLSFITFVITNLDEINGLITILKHTSISNEGVRIGIFPTRRIIEDEDEESGDFLGIQIDCDGSCPSCVDIERFYIISDNEPGVEKDFVRVNERSMLVMEVESSQDLETKDVDMFSLVGTTYMGVPFELVMMDENTPDVCQSHVESNEHPSLNHVCGAQGKHKYLIPFMFSDPFGVPLDGLDLKGPITMIDANKNAIGNCSFVARKKSDKCETVF